MIDAGMTGDEDWSFEFDSFGMNLLCCAFSINEEELDKLLATMTCNNEYQITFEVNVMLKHIGGKNAISDFRNRVSNLATSKEDLVSGT